MTSRNAAISDLGKSSRRRCNCADASEPMASQNTTSKRQKIATGRFIAKRLLYGEQHEPEALARDHPDDSKALFLLPAQPNANFQQLAPTAQLQLNTFIRRA